MKYNDDEPRTNMNNVETLRAFIERVKGEHRSIYLSDMSKPRCFVHAATTEYPCDALRAVLALEEMLKTTEKAEARVKELEHELFGIEVVERWLEALKKESAVHACPPAGAAVTPCCGRTPFELPRTDRMTVEASLITCGR